MKRPILSLAMYAAVLCWATPNATAGPITVADMIVAQALTADMVEATLNFPTFDHSSILTYSSSFDQTGASGIFGGTYLAGAIGGTLAVSVSGDPLYIATGETNDNENNINIGINVTIMSDMGQNTVNAQIDGFRWSGMVNMGLIGESLVYTGDIKVPSGTWAVKIIISPTDQLTSIFQAKTPLNTLEGTPYVDSGEVRFKLLPGDLFAGTMDMKVTPAPEPASLMLFGIGSLSLFGYAWRRRKKELV